VSSELFFLRISEPKSLVFIFFLTFRVRLFADFLIALAFAGFFFDLADFACFATTFVFFIAQKLCILAKLVKSQSLRYRKRSLSLIELADSPWWMLLPALTWIFAFRARLQKSSLRASMVWILWFFYEASLSIEGGYCVGDCSSRLDLTLILPVVLALNLWGLFKLFKKNKTPLTITGKNFYWGAVCLAIGLSFNSIFWPVQKLEFDTEKKEIKKIKKNGLIKYKQNFKLDPSERLQSESLGNQKYNLKIINTNGESKEFFSNSKLDFTPFATAANHSFQTASLPNPTAVVSLGASAFWLPLNSLFLGLFLILRSVRKKI
jgi:hypothetical protein